MNNVTFQPCWGTTIWLSPTALNRPTGCYVKCYKIFEYVFLVNNWFWGGESIWFWVSNLDGDYFIFCIYIYIYINWSTTFIIAMLQLSHISIHVINFFLSNFLIIVFNIYIFNIYTSPTFSLSLTFSFLHYFSFSPSLTYSTLHYPLHKYHSSSFSSSSLIFVSSYSHPLTINLLLSLSFYA